ncbi:MAG: hypothetical protein KF878_03990 [Planctomycetes bacterium]|nr:hypothetical protein [Planctomycetota bacterium]
MVRLDARRTSPLRCAYCHGPAEGAAPCPGCGTLLHPGCRDEVRGCPTLGCAAPPRRAEGAHRRPLRGLRAAATLGAAAVAFHWCAGELTRGDVPAWTFAARLATACRVAPWSSGGLAALAVMTLPVVAAAGRDAYREVVAYLRAPIGYLCERRWRGAALFALLALSLAALASTGVTATVL